MNRSIVTTAALSSLAAVSSAALLAVPAGAADTAPRQFAQRAAYDVTASVDKSVVVVGEDVVRIRGKVTPIRAARGGKVILQQRVEGKEKWSRTGTAKVRRNGRFVLKDKPSATGVRFYRVLKKGAKGMRAGRSAQLQVDVYTWGRLVDRAPGPIVNVERSWDALLANEYKVGLVSEVAGTEGTIEYTLGRKCTSLRGTYALTDASATGSTGSATLQVDGETKVSESLAVGSAKEHTTDITGAYRVGFRFTSTASPAAYPAVLDLEVLCRR